MADNFTQDQAQGIFGEFLPVLDEAVSGNDFSQNNVQGIFGIFLPVFDAAAGSGPAPAAAVATGFMTLNTSMWGT